MERTRTAFGQGRVQIPKGTAGEWKHAADWGRREVHGTKETRAVTEPYRERPVTDKKPKNRGYVRQEGKGGQLGSSKKALQPG